MQIVKMNLLQICPKLWALLYFVTNQNVWLSILLRFWWFYSVVWSLNRNGVLCTILQNQACERNFSVEMLEVTGLCFAFVMWRKESYVWLKGKGRIVRLHYSSVSSWYQFGKWIKSFWRSALCVSLTQQGSMSKLEWICATCFISLKAVFSLDSQVLIIIMNHLIIYSYSLQFTRENLCDMQSVMVSITMIWNASLVLLINVNCF